jgi:myo-inositol-1(or 4)-monophosphatase
MTTATHFSSITSLAIDAALRAGSLLREGFGTSFKITMKPGIKNYVTEYDHSAEKLIIDAIKREYPGHSFLAEESGSSGNPSGEIMWIIDPLDGTTNFAHNIPLFGVSIAAFSHKDGLICGVIYQPMSDELFIAEKGKGAFLNGAKIAVSKCTQIKSGISCTNFPRDVHENPGNCIDHFIHVLKLGSTIRNLGTSVINLAYVAAGRFDAYWTPHLHPWDISAGMLLIQEAGGKVTAYDGEPYDPLSSSPVVASNGLVHAEMLTLLKNIH